MPATNATIAVKAPITQGIDAPIPKSAPSMGRVVLVKLAGICPVLRLHFSFLREKAEERLEVDA
jgi:hypothetical protein